MKKRFILPITIFSLLLSFGLSACGGSQQGGDESGGGAQTSGSASSAQQEKITITAEGGKTALLKGESVQLTPSVEGVSWESDHPEFASVNGSGLVQAVAPGSAKITAKKNGYRDGTITIRVSLPSITVTAEENKTDLMYGETVQLASTVEGVSWVSSDTAVATVSDAGLVSAVGKGSATITASKTDYNNGTITINVDYPDITVTAADSKTRLMKGESAQLTPSVEGVTWNSSNQNVATVTAGGLVEAVSFGKTTISASKEHYDAGEIVIEVIRPNPTAVLHMEDAEHYSADGTWSTDNRGPGADGPVYTPSSGNPSDGTCIAYFGAGDKETMKFTADKAIRVELVLTIGYYYTIENVAASIGAKFNDQALTIEAQKYESEGTTSYTYKQFSLGYVTLLNSANNVLELTMLPDQEYYPYIDDLQFFAEEALNVQVVSSPTITLNKEFVVLEKADDTFQIEASETTGVTYASDKEAVATVSPSGLVTAVAPGQATITVSKQGMKSAKLIVGVGITAFDGTATNFEAEDCFVEGSITFRTASTGETIVNAWPKNATLVLVIKSSVSGTFSLAFNGRAGGGSYSSTDTNLAEDAVIRVNEGDPLTVTGTVTGRTFTDYSLGDITINTGINYITYKNLKTGPAIDYFKLTPKAA